MVPKTGELHRHISLKGSHRYLCQSVKSVMTARVIELGSRASYTLRARSTPQHLSLGNVPVRSCPPSQFTDLFNYYNVVFCSKFLTMATTPCMYMEKLSTKHLLLPRSGTLNILSFDYWSHSESHSELSLTAKRNSTIW